MDTVKLKFPPETQFNDDELFAFCSANSDLRIERTNKGELIVISPVGGKTGNIHFKIYSALSQWDEAYPDSGYLFDSSTGFRLPDQSVLSPDAAFIKKEKWESLREEDQEKFPPLAPDFIIEVRSGSDSLKQLQSKMNDWIRNGTLLAWLIDPAEKKAYVFDQKGLKYTVDSFDEKIDGNPVLPGLTFDLRLLLK